MTCVSHSLIVKFNGLFSRTNRLLTTRTTFIFAREYKDDINQKRKVKGQNQLLELSIMANGALTPQNYIVGKKMKLNLVKRKIKIQRIPTSYMHKSDIPSSTTLYPPLKTHTTL